MNCADLLSKESGVESRHLSKELLSSRPFRVHFFLSILEARNHSASCGSPSNLSALPSMGERVCV